MGRVVRPFARLRTCYARVIGFTRCWQVLTRAPGPPRLTLTFLLNCQ